LDTYACSRMSLVADIDDEKEGKDINGVVMEAKFPG
jgi:hypothetical protein